jgi:hypothetical protein
MANQSGKRNRKPRIQDRQPVAKEQSADDPAATNFTEARAWRLRRPSEGRWRIRAAEGCLEIGRTALLSLDRQAPNFTSGTGAMPFAGRRTRDPKMGFEPRRTAPVFLL